MTARDLGALRVPALGFGAMVLSGVYGEVDDARAEAALTAALDAGAVHVDTSDAYGADGDNERLVGRLIKGRRDEVVVATKFGLALFEGEAGRSQPVGYAFGELRVNAEPRLVRRYAERSLRNLGVDAIDLYYAHYPDPGVPIEETVGAMAELVKDGLVKHIGLSNVTAAQVRAAHAVHPVAAVQNEWSMWRPIEPELLATTRELGIGVVAWSPLGNGFLTGTVQGLGAGDFRHHAPRFSTENLARNNDRYAPIRALAGELEITPAQLALAWLLHQDEHVVAIPGSRTPAHIRENAAAAGITLDPATLARVDQALAGIEVTGGTLL
ncbi:aryl-alcohol dehydrogenase-like predicted oxidoreductase [Nonomuraea muscovyensis]|uniref:Aryl-alcohol dehydrogenase-like predicted oxidoreductase n=1 Tax=Nonomuraea muscovyensis TaxID=1124761 RepID=A0A7X0BZ80_9ACTN|nr:aldo/keto reductase [Nonomuraea muscovyensis]MBB6345308.1 aryl-alcohol dehydrogenase-like predicted oxidoreductase [Nonomuraea muscovyensis]